MDKKEVRGISLLTLGPAAARQDDAKMTMPSCWEGDGRYGSESNRAVDGSASPVSFSNRTRNRQPESGTAAMGVGTVEALENVR